MSKPTIRKSYKQGLDSIVRLVTGLEDQIQDLIFLQTKHPQRTIIALSSEIKRLTYTLDRKSKQLLETQQLNYQLQIRIRELERSLEADTAQSTSPIARDSHNSNLPPSLDLPWKKTKRTRSLRMKSGFKVGGQAGHKGVTLLQVDKPDLVIIHSIDTCHHCNTSLFSIESNSFQKRQVFEIVSGRLFVIEHQTEVKHCPGCQKISKGTFPRIVKAPVQYGSSVFSRLLYLHLYQLLPVARTAETMRICSIVLFLRQLFNELHDFVPTN